MQNRPSSPQQPPRRPVAPQSYNARPYNAPPSSDSRPSTPRPPMQQRPLQGQYRQAAPHQTGVPQQQRRPVTSPPRQTPPPTPAKQAYLGRRRPFSFLPLAIACAVLLAFGCLMQFVFFPNGWLHHNAQPLETVTEIVSSRGVIISEVMTANKTALNDENNLYTDWIEIGNNGRNAVNISGWSLTDKLSRTNYFSFPEGTTVAPGEYLIVYASGQLKNTADSAFHAPFKLSSTGDTLILTDESGTVVESINIPALTGNQSYARTENGWHVTMEYTPGLENTSLSFAMLTTLDPIENSPLQISEVLASNASYAVCADGSFYDWIEIHNISSEAIDLSGYGLSDSPDRPSRWRFPDITLLPDEYLVVYASGLDMQTNDEYHTNFRLRAEGESVLLYNAQGQLLDNVTYENLKQDQSFIRRDDAFQRSSSPTPGKANQ